MEKMAETHICFICEGAGYLTEATDPFKQYEAITSNLNDQVTCPNSLLESLKQSKADFDKHADTTHSYTCNACKGTGKFSVTYTE
jgi:RecJ-like exonuclease